MEFGIEKCAMLTMKNEKREIIEGIELSNQESIRTLIEKENFYSWDLIKEINTDTLDHS